MNLIKCENEHFYDADKFLSCPHCSNQIARVHDQIGANQKQGKIDTKPPDTQTEEPIRENFLGKTVGWLVCVEGCVSGESFTLREGNNYIGRAAHMDISLIYEPTVSREKHAVITYDSADNSFSLSSPEHSDRTFCNGKAVYEKKVLKNRDFITLGDCSLLFVALCNSSFHWRGQTSQRKGISL